MSYQKQKKQQRAATVLDQPWHFVFGNKLGAVKDDVLGFRTNVTTFAATATCGQGEPSMIRVSMSPTAMFGPGGGLTFTTNTVATLLAGDTLVGWS